jgi:hypothetical protein
MKPLKQISVQYKVIVTLLKLKHRLLSSKYIVITQVCKYNQILSITLLSKDYDVITITLTQGR